MITLKGFFRKKVTKIYLVTISLLFTVFLLLIGFISYFSYEQDSIFSNYSELVVINDYDLSKSLSNIDNIDNIKRVLAFRENKKYDVFTNSSYTIYDTNGNLVDSSTNTEKKIMWNVMEKEGLEDYILVFPDADFNLTLKENEIVIGINDFWYDSYDSSYYKDIINKKIGFLYNEENIEFTINDVLRVDTSILIVSKNLYDKLLDKNELFVYTANITSIKNQAKLKETLNNLSDSSNYISSIVTYYKNDASNTISSLYDLLDVLNLISYVSIAIFLIILIVIIRNIISDSKRNLILNKKIGFNNIQIKLDVFKKLIFTYIFSILISVINFSILGLIIKYNFEINLFLLDLKFVIKLLIIGFILNLLLVIMNSYNLDKQKYDYWFIFCNLVIRIFKKGFYELIFGNNIFDRNLTLELLKTVCYK